MSKSKTRRGIWGIDLTVEPARKDAFTLPGHPLNYIDELGREESRLHTMGNVLASIARRAAACRLANGMENEK